jgi:hypothetical protein
VLLVHQPVVALLHALGSTPITPYSLRATRPWSIPVFLSLTFWGGIWTIPIAWVLDRLPRGWIYWVGAFGLGALPPTLTTWFVIFPLKGPRRPTPAHPVGAVNALIVNGIWGLGFAFVWSRMFVAPPVTPGRPSDKFEPKCENPPAAPSHPNRELVVGTKPMTPPSSPTSRLLRRAASRNDSHF